MNQGALCSTFHELRQFDIHEKPLAFDDIGLSLRHRLVGRATRPEAVAVLAECRVPLRLKPLQERLLGLRDQLRWNFQVGHPAVRLRNLHPKDRLRWWRRLWSS
jgi:hypothetical protein